MPTQTYPYLALSDGTTTVEFQNGSGTPTNWQLAADGWAPAIPAYNPSALAGRGQYADVVETFTINVRGSTAADCYSNLATLIKLLDQADRWALGDNVAAVLLKCAPQGSTLASTAAPFQAAVMGRATGDGTSGVQLSARWNDAGKVYEIPGVQIKIVRRNPWVLGSASASSSATDNGALATVNLSAALNTISPTKSSLTGYQGGTGKRCFLLISSNDDFNRLVLGDVSAAGTGVRWTNPNDAANYAQWTNVLRYTPTGTAEDESGAVVMSPGALGGVPLIAVFACVRNNSTTTSFMLRAKIATTGSRAVAHTPLIYVAPDAGTYVPEWVCMGFVALPSTTLTTFTFKATASAVAGSLDIGAAALINIKYRGSGVLAYTESGSNTGAKTFVCDPATLTLPEPTTLGTDPFTVEGDMTLETIAQNVVCVNLNSGRSLFPYWRAVSAGVVDQNTVTLTRLPGYLVPQ